MWKRLVLLAVNFTNKKDYITNICLSFKAFPISKSLQMHLLIHKGKQFNCQTCGEAFFKETSLIRHKETVHGLDIN